MRKATAPSLQCLRALRVIAIADTPKPCISVFQRRHASSENLPAKGTNGPRKPTPKIEYRSAATVRNEGERTLEPLSDPIGLHDPPFAGDNTGVDTRSLRQRRDDFVNYDKHLERRQKMKSQISRSYFRDFNEMKHFKGKAFIAPERAFKAEHALYFPNLHGRTLQGQETDTTKVLRGRVSVVSVLSSGWAENQVATWCSESQNPELHALLDTTGTRESASDKAQLVEINHEPNTLKYWILRLFSYRLKAQRLKEHWGRYFVVRKGFDDVLRESIAIFNQKVGYVYLLDQRCKIRWAGNAVAEESEKASMVRNLGRLLDEAKETGNVGNAMPRSWDRSTETKNAVEEKAEVVLGEVHGLK